MKAKKPDITIRASDPLQSAVLMLVNGMTDKSAAVALQQKLGLAKAIAKTTVKKARAKITVTAAFDREQELGQAYIRLNNIYSHAISTQSFATALTAQKELNKLMDL